jgi:hypothetical protein
VIRYARFYLVSSSPCLHVTEDKICRPLRPRRLLDPRLAGIQISLVYSVVEQFIRPCGTVQQRRRRGRRVCAVRNGQLMRSVHLSTSSGQDFFSQLPAGGLPTRLFRVETARLLLRSRYLSCLTRSSVSSVEQEWERVVRTMRCRGKREKVVGRRGIGWAWSPLMTAQGGDLSWPGATEITLPSSRPRLLSDSRQRQEPTRNMRSRPWMELCLQKWTLPFSVHRISL